MLLRVDLSRAGEGRVLTAYHKVAAEWTNIITESLKKQSLLQSPDAKGEMRARVHWTGRVNVGEQCGGVVADAHMSTRTVCRHIWSTSICTISSQYRKLPCSHVTTDMPGHPPSLPAQSMENRTKPWRRKNPRGFSMWVMFE
eukprot:GHVU01091048.1.p1 GENE.GHVU01091048.1~~GHVU01091048.1.p1  ORF type:complete len:142 (-),score=2.92 GHVU01091048.1:219-644(-)